MTTGGPNDSVGLLGFGNSAEYIAIGGNIDLTGGTGENINFSFPFPSAGEIRSISAFLSTDAPMALPSTNITITAQLYSAGSNSNNFLPVPGTAVNLTPVLTGSIPLGTSIGEGGTLPAPVAVDPFSRYMLVFSATSSDTSISYSIFGYASASVQFISY